MNKSSEKDFFDSPSMITYILIGLLVVLIILSQSFAIQSHMEAGDIFRSIINHNSIYLVSLMYVILIRVKFGNKYFDYLNVVQIKKPKRKALNGISPNSFRFGNS